jgi:hypothetical protein
MEQATAIAVFAAFRIVIHGTLLSNAELKRICTLRRRDMSCYARQKRQDPARDGKKWHARIAGMCHLPARRMADAWEQTRAVAESRRTGGLTRPRATTRI